LLQAPPLKELNRHLVSGLLSLRSLGKRPSRELYRHLASGLFSLRPLGERLLLQQEPPPRELHRR
jgi:hypothetical protein